MDRRKRSGHGRHIPEEQTSRKEAPEGHISYQSLMLVRTWVLERDGDGLVAFREASPLAQHGRTGGAQKMPTVWPFPGSLAHGSGVPLGGGCSSWAAGSGDAVSPRDLTNTLSWTGFRWTSSLRGGCSAQKLWFKMPPSGRSSGPEMLARARGGKFGKGT